MVGSTITASLQGKAGRTAVVAVATSGLVLGVSAAAAAEPTSNDVIKAPSLKATSLTAAAVERAGTQTAVVVDSGAAIGYAAVTVSAEAPPPPPPPVVRTVTSRTRTAPAVERETGNANTNAAAAETTDAAEETSAPAVEEETAAAPPIDGSTASAVVAEAFKYVGVPYVSGGASPSGMDCSGFVQYVFAQVGVSLPRTSGAQAGAGYRVSAAEARAGDLIYSPGHIGIYLGDGQHIAARNASTPLKAGPVYMKNPTYIRVLG
ncbi:NLP/P60 family protein [Serinibacter arcticus]|uniref:NLP/P60 family protein n=1 Tax=Serinibacter arcticus TaxID=1655435 RepID=A0A4Z1DY22_9MICO|nr:NLP/P60 family protein [Serinibacter arcticus]